MTPLETLTAHYPAGRWALRPAYHRGQYLRGILGGYAVGVYRCRSAEGTWGWRVRPDSYALPGDVCVWDRDLVEAVRRMAEKIAAHRAEKRA